MFSVHSQAPAHDVATPLLKGQMAWQHLRARTSIVAAEGDLQLEIRDHSLAWLGDVALETPVMTITLHEGERYTMQHSGMVTISAMQAHCARFVVQPSGTDCLRQVRERCSAFYQRLASVTRA